MNPGIITDCFMQLAGDCARTGKVQRAEDAEVERRDDHCSAPTPVGKISQSNDVLIFKAPLPKRKALIGSAARSPVASFCSLLSVTLSAYCSV